MGSNPVPSARVDHVIMQGGVAEEGHHMQASYGLL